MSAQREARLVHATICVSGIIYAPLEHVWRTVRSFTTIAQWLPKRDDGVALRSSRLPGSEEFQIGVRRLMEIEGHGYVEEVRCLDDYAHELKYATISYPGATNPFPYSLVNFQGKILNKTVTIGNSTFMQWSGTFQTEPEGVQIMVTELEAWLKSAMYSLARFLQNNNVGTGALSMPVPEEPRSNPHDITRLMGESLEIMQKRFSKSLPAPEYVQGNRNMTCLRTRLGPHRFLLVAGKVRGEPVLATC
ncbi:hypothetical protein WJX73_004200 [Symbiochloris irregularis]|uniref:SRPBCC family protein n=1 Tax=Symbiochloris irregularis TaxID=706552 RepID=A0AAW1NXL7_9CHLO